MNYNTTAQEMRWEAVALSRPEHHSSWGLPRRDGRDNIGGHRNGWGPATVYGGKALGVFDEFQRGR